VSVKSCGGCQQHCVSQLLPPCQQVYVVPETATTVGQGKQAVPKAQANQCEGSLTLNHAARPAIYHLRRCLWLGTVQVQAEGQYTRPDRTWMIL
jgi:hypothetical protein